MSSQLVTSRASHRGYVLIMTLGVLAILSVVTLALMERLDRLRFELGATQSYAHAQWQEREAKEAALYYMATRSMTSRGYGDASSALIMDGRSYRFGSEKTLLQLQDQRGLVSLNVADRGAIKRLLMAHGLETNEADAWVDVLDDALDSDSLKRLNGAEADDYRSRGRLPARNDWLASVSDLSNLKYWGESGSRLQGISDFFHVGLSNTFNPNTAPVEVLRAVLFPMANEAGIRQILNLREAGLLADPRVATKLTGVNLDRDDYWLNPSFEARLRVVAGARPVLVEYNLRLTPSGDQGPWQVTERRVLPLKLKAEPHVETLPEFPLQPR